MLEVDVGDDIIMHCYRLALRYSRDPDEFLAKPLSAIRRHVTRTAKLVEELNPPEDSDG